jgi:hypothetical protein
VAISVRQRNSSHWVWNTILGTVTKKTLDFVITTTEKFMQEKSQGDENTFTSFS